LSCQDTFKQRIQGLGALLLRELLVPHCLQVKDAMNEINAAQRLRMAAVEKAEAAKIKVSLVRQAEKWWLTQLARHWWQRVVHWTVASLVAVAWHCG
jgi:hypothetical protein